MTESTPPDDGRASLSTNTSSDAKGKHLANSFSFFSTELVDCVLRVVSRNDLTFKRCFVWVEIRPPAIGHWKYIICVLQWTTTNGTNQVGHLSKTPLNLLKIHEIGSVDTFKSKQQHYDQIRHLWPPYQKLLGLSHFSWLSHSPVGHCTDKCTMSCLKLERPLS